MKTLIRELQDGLPPAGDALAALRPPLVTALAALEHATAWLLDDGAKSIAKGAAGATPYLALCGSVLGGWLLAKSAVQAPPEGGSFPAAKLKTARFYAANLLGDTAGLAPALRPRPPTPPPFHDPAFRTPPP